MRELLPFRKEDVSTEDVVWLLADLKTYLGLDLPEHKFAAIQASYWPLRAVVLKIHVGVDQVLTESFGADYKLRADAYGSLTEITNSFDSSFGSIDLPLDEDLCGYVQSLEFLHYAVGMPELLSKSIPSKRSVVPVSREIGELTECVVTKWNVETHPKAPTNIFSLNELPAFFEEFDLKIWEVVVKASSKSFEASELTNEIVQDTYLILHNYFWLLREAHWAEVDVDKRQISPWLVIGALLCALDAKKHTPVAHAPYWHLMPEKQGVNTPRPTRSLRTALKDTVHLQRMADRMTLEHRLMWRNKLEWFCGSLYGMQELVIPSLRFYAAVLMKLMEVTRRIRDADLNKGAQAEFMDYIYHNTLALHKRRMEQ